MNTKSKPDEINSPLRVPKAKNKLGLKIPKIALPHDDLIFADTSKLQIVPEKNTNETLISPSGQTSQSTDRGEIAPTKNYQKVANSITKQAIPDGFFKGKDKHLYDVLYSLTRGAIEPKRSVRINKTKLMKLAGIGSRITFDSCVERLQLIGLLNIKIFTGEHEGNEFEILLPEEVKTLTSQTSLTSLTSHAQKLVRLVRLETSQTSQSTNLINADTYENPKTFFKDYTKTDDESAQAFSEFLEKISAACNRITGKTQTKRDAKNWGTLAELLILELETAAKRADAISSVPAFLTEVLRRKLMNASAAGPKSQKAFTDVIGQPNESGTYEIKPLDEKEREAALELLREFADDDFLQDFEKWYTPADWKWLMKDLQGSDLTRKK